MTEAMAQQLFGADIRIEAMFWVPGITASQPQEFEDFVDDALWDENEVRAALPFLRAGDDSETVIEEMNFHHKFGFFVQLATPVRSRFREGSHQSSWGHYRTKWFYINSLDDLCGMAIAWQELCLALDRKADAEPVPSR